MASRDELHRLADSLPEGALDSAGAALANMQIWPPPAPLEFKHWKEEFRERARRERHEHRSAMHGTISGGVAGGSYKQDASGKVDCGHFSSNRWENGTFIVETHRFFLQRL